MVKNNAVRLIRPLLLALVVCVSFVALPEVLHLKVQSNNLTSVSDTLSSSRLSFYGLMGAGNIAGTTLLTLNTTTAPSTSSSQLASPSASTVLIGSTIYNLSAVMENADQSKFSISTGIAAGDITAGKAVIATQSAIHTVRFQAATAVQNGAFRILIKATAAGSTQSQDGIPDGDGFDYKPAAPSIACPTNNASYAFFPAAGYASASAVVVGSSTYHAFTCKYSGPGSNSTNGNFTTNPIQIASLINPAPKSGHAVGTADTYTVIVQQLDASAALIDQTVIQIGAIENVRVSATVDPQITFKIAGLTSTEINGSTGACGTDVAGTFVTSTPQSVPFGSVLIAAFTYAGQSLEVSTNAVSGYAVTAQENDQLGRNANVCTGTSGFANPCIDDADGNGTNMTPGASGRWDSATYKGFGYGLYKVAGSGTAAFLRSDTSGNCSGGTFCARQFADLEASIPAQTIFSSSTVANQDNVDVCYKIVVSSTQQAGDYENHLIYTATATF